MEMMTFENLPSISYFGDIQESNVSRMYRSVTLMNLVKGIGVDNQPDTLEELRVATGYDYVNFNPLYNADTVGRVVNFFREKHYRGWPTSEAYRALGRCAVAGWTNTAFGKVTLLMVPLLNPDNAVYYLPSIFDRTRLFGRRYVEKVAPNRWRFNLTDEIMPADYIAGMVEAGAALVGQIRDFRVIVGPIVNENLTQITIEVSY